MSGLYGTSGTEEENRHRECEEGKLDAISAHQELLRCHAEQWQSDKDAAAVTKQ